METARSCESFKQWLVHARDVLHISPQQAISTWTHLRETAPENEKNIKSVPFFRRACTETKESTIELPPERRARSFARKTALNIVRRVLDDQDVPVAELRDAPIAVMAHDLESEKEGGCKMFCSAPTRFIVEKAFAEPGPRVEQTKQIFKNYVIVPADHEKTKFKPEWVLNGQSVTKPPVTSFYNERFGGYQDDWQEECVYAKPYALVLDLDAHSLVNKDPIRFLEAREMMEKENRHGAPLLRQICAVVAESLMEKTGLTAAFLVFTSEGNKPSYRIYVRFVASEHWTYTKSVQFIFADLNEMPAFMNKNVIKKLEKFPWFCGGMLDTKTFGKGWDRFPGMCKWSKDTSKARFCQREPMRALSDEAVLYDWDHNKELCLLTSLALVFDSPVAPIRFNDANPLKRSHYDQVEGEREIRDAEMVVETLIEEVLRRYPVQPHNFLSGKCKVCYKDGHPFQARFLCAKDNTWCPFRLYDIDKNSGSIIMDEHVDKAHEPMAEGKVACFIRLDEPFPCVEFNCFSDRCRKEGERYFNLGRLNPTQVLRLKRSLSVATTETVAVDNL